MPQPRLRIVAALALGSVLSLPAPAAGQIAHDSQFAALNPEAQAALMRQHLERWLEVHRPDLSDRQIALVNEVMAFATPDLYRQPPDATVAAQQAALSERLACSLGSDLAATISSRGAPPRRLERTWTQSARNWVEWIVDCVVK